ncbi:MAG: phosphoglycerate dehydrogenase [Hydrogenophaga sp.]|uniref:phosphoglycerate dehydrogenase n=1 Tax=Hydrogenophaga sp. TaxID=1904254 RepID=UPI00262A155D|nr:phosphoglycerate dehydrogenase [Hydrogenophaga sp.]MDM7941674.1 phosphoglycerate dehydrogenase [Hydrogenophaga sp.]
MTAILPTPSASAAATSTDRHKIRFLLLEGIHPSAVAVLRAAGYSQIESLPGALPDDELKARIADVHFLGIRSRTQLSAEVLSHARRLAAVGCFCIGTNQVDLAAARQRGVAVFNAPFSNTRSVAELVLAEAILLMRGVPEKNAEAHRGGWLKSASHSHEIRGKTLGIVGYGAIGSQLSVLAEALGMKVVYFDVATRLPLGNARPLGTLADLLGSADVVSLHVPETADTQWMIDAPQLALMKPGAVLINASRGSVVVIDALADALRRQALLGAAIDVFPQEPHSNDDRFESPLRGLDNVILTPHIGGSTLEAQENIGIEVADKLVRYSDNGTTTSAVNFPEVALPAHPGQHRLLHIHRNVPGVLSGINRVFSDHQINIAAQYLQTREDLGYVVMDIDAAHSELALSELARVPGTLRSRVLF